MIMLVIVVARHECRCVLRIGHARRFPALRVEVEERAGATL